MAKLECPNGHLAVIRHDPASTGMRAECDRCGWEASYHVNRDAGDYELQTNHEALAAQKDEASRRELTAGGPARRRSEQ